MEQYQIRVTNTTRIVLALVCIPLTIVPAILFIAVKIPNLPEWAVWAMMFSMIGIAIAVTLYVVKRLAPQALLTLRDDGFSVDFIKKEIFTPKSFLIKISDVTNFFAEGRDDLYYLNFTTNVQPRKFNIEASSKSEEDLASFTILMGKVAKMIVDNNEHTTATDTAKTPTDPLAATHTITSVSMYERWWAKGISVFALLMFVLILAAMMFAPDKAPDPWRMAPLVIFGVPFMYKVWYHNYKKNKR